MEVKKKLVSKKLRINVSGKRYETLESTLARHPGTLLSLPQREHFFDDLNNEYFFDRDRRAFGAILSYCQTGLLIKPADLDERIFAADLKYFGFEMESLKHIPNVISEHEHILPEKAFFRKLWQVFEYPDTSMLARIVSLFSMLVIFVSIVIFCLETLPEFRKRQEMRLLRKSNTTENYDRHEEFSDPLFLIETTCIAWFTIEYVLRLVASPRKLSFLYQPLNIIDIVAILPFYIMLLMDEMQVNISSLSILRVLRLVRVFRIFKLSRYSKGLKILGYTFRASLKELLLLAFFLLNGVILFASAAYYCEEQVEGTEFKSIIHSFWWAVVTMTTVGYGDIYPETFSGKLVGSLCVLVGVLTIAFPVPVIVNNFAYYYTREQNNSEPLNKHYLETPLASNGNNEWNIVALDGSSDSDVSTAKTND